MIGHTIKLYKTTVVHRSFLGNDTTTKTYYSVNEIYNNKPSEFYACVSSSIEHYKIVGLSNDIDDSELPLILDGFDYKRAYSNVPPDVFLLPTNEPFELI